MNSLTPLKEETKEEYYSRICAELQTHIQDKESESLIDGQGPTDVYLQSTITEILDEGIECQECPICLDIPTDPVLTPCAHLLCRACVIDFINNGKNNSICPVCRFDIQAKQLTPVVVPATTLTRTDGKNISKKAHSFISSTKLDRLLYDMREIQREDRSSQGKIKRKIVVFSQWTHMLDLVGDLLTSESIGWVRFDGSLSQTKREEVLLSFADDSSIQVLVISLKAGGVGLNLTSASVVILLDPWWNPGVEEQAIDRVHRLGQLQDVVVKKYIVADTVEEMVLTLQERKAKLARNVLSVGHNKNDAKLNLADLMNFFK